MRIDDETLMALADGELDAEEAARLQAAIAADPEARARLRGFVETRDRLRRLADGGPDSGADTGADAALIARIRAASVAPSSVVAPVAAPVPASANRNRAPLAAVAAAVTVLAVGLGWWGWDGRGPAGLTGPEIAALDTLASGEGLALADGRDLTMIDSYRVASGALCREYETADDRAQRVVIACREGAVWQPRLAGDRAADDAYRPASGEIAAVEDWLENAGAGDPLTPEAEAAALAQ